MYLYVIMPAGSDPNFAHKRHVLQDKAGNYGLRLHMPLEENEAWGEDGPTPAMILQNIKSACCVIADLSLERPSCYFELGLAQAMAQPTVLIAAQSTVIHQAFGSNELHWYAHMHEYSDLIDTLFASVAEGESEGHRQRRKAPPP